MSQFGRNTVGRLNVEIDADGTKARAELDATSAKMEETAQKVEKSSSRLTSGLNRAGESFRRVTGVVTGTIGAFTAWVGIISLVVTGLTALISSLRRTRTEVEGATEAYEQFIASLQQPRAESADSLFAGEVATLRELTSQYRLSAEQFDAAFELIQSRRRQRIREQQRELLTEEQRLADQALAAAQGILDPVTSPLAQQILQINEALQQIRNAPTAFLGEDVQRRTEQAAAELQARLEASVSQLFRGAADEAAATLRAPFDFFRQGVNAYAAAVREQVQAQRDATAAQNRAMTEAIENAIEARIGDTLRSIEASLNRNLTSVDDAARAAQFVALNRSRLRDG